MNIRKLLWIAGGFAALGLGTLGIFLPILPTVPFYLLTMMCFANSSQKLKNWFQRTKLYKKHLAPYLEAGGLPKKGKIALISLVSVQIAIAGIILHKSTVGLIILAAVYLGFLVSIIFIVKTVDPKPTKSGKKAEKSRGVRQNRHM